MNEDLAREFLRAATRDPAAEWPGLPVGAVIGQLTQREALDLVALCEAFGDAVGLAFVDGQPRLTGTERVLSDAA